MPIISAGWVSGGWGQALFGSGQQWAQGAMGTKWSTGSSIWTWGRTSSLWGWKSTGTGCPGRLWILLLWRFSRPAWTWSSAAYCRWPCFGRRVGLDDPQRSLPTPNILWFCDSVKYHWQSYLWLQQVGLDDPCCSISNAYWIDKTVGV